ncbi:uncharacterized protein PG986_006521 [Apiospora aurea]|uniref:Uncharacterized protein n=1 Tax=Apiospora aurea TaxID=335848 RepID=A0ABR1QL42_9PEZI
MCQLGSFRFYERSSYHHRLHSFAGSELLSAHQGVRSLSCCSLRRHGGLVAAAHAGTLDHAKRHTTNDPSCSRTARDRTGRKSLRPLLRIRCVRHHGDRRPGAHPEPGPEGLLRVLGVGGGVGGPRLDLHKHVDRDHERGPSDRDGDTDPLHHRRRQRQRDGHGHVHGACPLDRLREEPRDRHGPSRRLDHGGRDVYGRGDQHSHPHDHRGRHHHYIHRAGEAEPAAHRTEETQAWWCLPPHARHERLGERVVERRLVLCSIDNDVHHRLCHGSGVRRCRAVRIRLPVCLRHRAEQQQRGVHHRDRDGDRLQHRLGGGDRGVVVSPDFYRHRVRHRHRRGDERRPGHHGRDGLGHAHVHRGPHDDHGPAQHDHGHRRLNGHALPTACVQPQHFFLQVSDGSLAGQYIYTQGNVYPLYLSTNVAASTGDGSVSFSFRPDDGVLLLDKVGAPVFYDTANPLSGAVTAPGLPALIPVPATELHALAGSGPGCPGASGELSSDESQNGGRNTFLLCNGFLYLSVDGQKGACPGSNEVATLNYVPVVTTSAPPP